MDKIPIFILHPLYLRTKLLSLNLNPVFYYTNMDIKSLYKDDILIALSLFSILELVGIIKNEKIKVVFASNKKELLFFNDYKDIFEIYTKTRVKRDTFIIPYFNIDMAKKIDFKFNDLLINETSVNLLHYKNTMLKKVLNFIKGV